MVRRRILRSPGRGHAFGAPPRGRHLDRPHGVRRQSGRLRADRDHGQGGRPVRLPAAVDHPQGQRHQDHRGPQGPQGRPRDAVVEFGQPGAAGAVQVVGRGAGRGLRGHLFGQARQLDHGRRQQGLRRRPDRLERARPDGRQGHREPGRPAHHLAVGAVPDHLLRLCPQPDAGPAEGGDGSLPDLRLGGHRPEEGVRQEV